MFKNRFSHNMPELDTTSTADISFILLIFFLITTSMSVESGMRRKLPPVVTEQEAPQQIKKENLMVIDVLPDHVVKCNDEVVTMPALVEGIKGFAGDKNHVISLRTAEDAVYEDYFKVYQLIVNTARSNKMKIRISETEYPAAATDDGGGKGAGL